MIYEHYAAPERIIRKERDTMVNSQPVEAVRSVLRQFQNGYRERDLDTLDEFMAVFAQNGAVELIGIGAFERGGVEWFEGLDKIKEIIQSDWEYWGAVEIDVDGAKISLNGDTAWLTTTGTLEQTDTFDKAMPIYLNQMKEIIESGYKDFDEKLVEATHFGMRRLRERLKGVGHKWPFVISAVLQKEEDQWRIHTIHWSMPVD
jgi:hypothetical protein